MWFSMASFCSGIKRSPMSTLVLQTHAEQTRGHRDDMQEEQPTCVSKPLSVQSIRAEVSYKGGKTGNASKFNIKQRCSNTPRPNLPLVLYLKYVLRPAWGLETRRGQSRPQFIITWGAELICSSRKHINQSWVFAERLTLKDSSSDNRCLQMDNLDYSTMVAVCGYTLHFGCHDAVSLNVGGIHSGPWPHLLFMRLGQHNMDQSTTAVFIKEIYMYTHTSTESIRYMCNVRWNSMFPWAGLV